MHLAWLIQPTRDLPRLHAANLDGTVRVLAAAAEAGVRTLLYASSIGAYSRGDGMVDESWPTHGIARSTYSRQKAYVERLLDSFELEHPEVRTVRLRPGLIFQARAASEIRRFFMGTLFPNRLLRPGFIPVVPRLPGVRFQAVHTEDVAEAFRLALHAEVAGALNVAAEPVLSLDDVADALGARTVPLPGRIARAAADITWRMRLHPVEPGWVDLAIHSPLMDTDRIRTELGWEPEHDARAALAELLSAVRRREGGSTPTLESDARRSRAEELRTGQGARYTPGDVPGDVAREASTRSLTGEADYDG